MLRTQVSLTHANRAVLDRLAEQTGKSVAGLIRQAVEKCYGPDAEGDIAVIRQSAGAWAGREATGAQYVEALRSGGRLGRAL
jgi:hypothetical protein